MGKICRKIASSDQLCSSSIISEFRVMFSRVFSVHFWPFFLFLSVLVVWWGPPIFDQEGDVTEEARVPRPCQFSCCFTTACQEGWGGSRVFSYALVLLGQNHVPLYHLVSLHLHCWSFSPRWRQNDSRRDMVQSNTQRDSRKTKRNCLSPTGVCKHTLNP